MSIGVMTCSKLRKKSEELRQHSIYIRPDDSDTDFDFYVLIDSEEARKKNDFLKKLQIYINSGKISDKEKRKRSQESLLNSLDPNNLGLKVLIEKYPYRLFVVIDKNDNDWKVEGKTPLDNAFPWGKYSSQFIKKRICWLDKEEFEKALGKNEESNLLNSATNIFISFNPYERAKMWLYYKWIEHLVENRDDLHKEKLTLIIALFEEGMQLSSYSPITLFSLEGGAIKCDSKIFSISDKFEIKLIGNSNNSFMESQGKKEHVKDNELLSWEGTSLVNFSNTIFYKRHEIVENSLYSEYVSGSLEHYYILHEGYRPNFFVIFRALENALLRLGIYDERIYKFNGENPSCTKYFELGQIRIIELENDIFGLQVYNMDCLIIHQGLLDKLSYSDREIAQKINDLKNFIPFIVVTSGRGHPANLPENVKFLPFSVIEKTIAKCPHEKFLLTHIIFSLKKGE